MDSCDSHLARLYGYIYITLRTALSWDRGIMEAHARDNKGYIMGEGGGSAQLARERGRQGVGIRAWLRGAGTYRTRSRTVPGQPSTS